MMKRIVMMAVLGFALSVGVFSAFALPPGGNLGSPLNPSAWSIPLGGVWPFATAGYLGGDIKTKGGISVAALGTPAGCAVAKTGTGTGTTWGYRVTALSSTGETLACSQVTVSGNATLDATHYNTVSWTAVSGARGYYVYRTAAPGTPNTTGKLGTGACTPTVFAGTSAVDNGLCADSSSVPSVDTSAQMTAAGPVSLPDGTASAPSMAFTSDADGTGTGIYRVGANDLGIATNGVLRFDCSTTACTSALDLALGTNDLTCNQATATYNALTTTIVPGLTVQNTTDSTAGVPVQNSPSIELHSEVWNTTGGGSNEVSLWKIVNEPTSSASPKGFLNFYHKQASGADGLRMSVRGSDGYTDFPGLGISAGSYVKFDGGGGKIDGLVASGDRKISRYLHSDTTATVSGALADGATAVAVQLASETTYSTEGAEVVRILNGTTKIAAFDLAGAIQITVGGGATPTCAAAHRNKLWVVNGGVGVTDTLYVCLKAAANTYSWVSITTGG